MSPVGGHGPGLRRLAKTIWPRGTTTPPTARRQGRARPASPRRTPRPAYRKPYMKLQSQPRPWPRRARLSKQPRLQAAVRGRREVWLRPVAICRGAALPAGQPGDQPPGPAPLQAPDRDPLPLRARAPDPLAHDFRDRADPLRARPCRDDLACRSGQAARSWQEGPASWAQFKTA